MLQADTLLKHGRIYTMEAGLLPVECLAIRSGRVLATGTEPALSGLEGTNTEVVDLGGRVVLPGLTDAHLHLEQYALSLTQVDCGTQTVQDCLSRIGREAGQSSPGEWIIGHGWDHNLWGRHGTVAELDGVTPRNPTYASGKSLHLAWVNSLALQRAGITAATPDPPGGVIQRDPRGQPTGILLEGATALVSGVIDPPSIDQLASSFSVAQERLWRLGITGLHDFDGPRCLTTLLWMRQQGRLGLRVLKNLPLEHLEPASALGLRSGLGDEWVRLGGMKVFADGALGPGTAAMLEAYEGEPTNLGLSLIDHDLLVETGLRAVEAGFSLAVHAIGDRANRLVLDAMATIRSHEVKRGIPPLRHRIEHMQLISAVDLPRPSELRILASMQPIHATSDKEMAERRWGDRVRSSYAYAWNSLLRTGAVLVFGSDAPVESPNPFWGMHAAVTRTKHDAPSGEDGWIAREKIHLREALEAYTLGPSFAAGLEDQLGRLAPGYLADLIVLDSDPFQCTPQGVAELLPVATMVNGKWVFRRI